MARLSPQRRRGRIIVLSGPSGAGKTTLHQRLLALPEFRRRLAKVVSVTTRPPRPEEKPGRDYIFVTSKMFAYKKRAGHFLENERVFRYEYGTPWNQVRQHLARGRDVLLCIDVKGAAQVRRRHPEAFFVFVRPPSLKVLRERLKRRRTETPEALKLRLETARQELKQARFYDRVIVNDRLDRALSDLAQTLRALSSEGKGKTIDNRQGI